MVREYINNVNGTQDTYYSPDPYYFIRIDTLNHLSGGIQKYGFSSFAAGDEIDVGKPGSNNFTWTSLKNDAVDSYLSLTKTITLPGDSYYLIELMLEKGPTVDPTTPMSLTVNGTSIWEESGVSKWRDYGTIIRMPITYLESGANTFILYLPKHARAGWFKISQIKRYEGGKDLINESETRLDLISAEFTQNGVNELDMMTLQIAMKDDYWTDEIGNNPLAFDMGDHITLVLGQDSVEARPMFGGYIAGWDISDGGDVLTLSCVDRLWDLQRTMVYKNFYIGKIPTDDGSGTMTFTQFPTVNEVAKYLANSLYRINYDSVVRDYIFYNNFGEDVDTQLNTEGFDIAWDTDFGHPAPCIKLTPTKLGENSVTLYSSDVGEWDAYDHNLFGFDYFVGGVGIKYPIRFNVEIDMYKEGELPASAITYTIHFNGPQPKYANTVIKNIIPTFNGKWQRVSVDLKDAFDDKNISNSYYIKEIRLIGLQEQTNVLNRRCSSIYIDHVIGLRYLNQSVTSKSAGSKNALEELTDMCKQTNQVAYSRPGMERSEDSLIMIPKLFYTIPIEINDDNVINVTGIEYKPLEWGMINWAADSYKTYKEVSGTSKYIDNDSEKHYGIIMDHEFYSDAHTWPEAQVLSRSKVTLNAWKYIGFGITMMGSTLFEPGQYVTVKLPKYHILGAYEVQSITHKINFLSETFDTDLDFGRPSGAFYNMVRALRNSRRDMSNIRNDSAYASGGALAAGMETSLGAYDV